MHAPTFARPAHARLVDLNHLTRLTPLAGAALCLALAGCQSSPKLTDTQQRINQEVKAAVDHRNPAKAPDAVMSALVQPLATEQKPRAARRNSEQRFDLVFNHASVNQVFDAIAAGSKYSFVLPPDLSGTVAVNLKDVTAADALEVLRDMYGFEYRINGNRITVQGANLQTRMFQVAYPSGKRVGYTDTRVTSGSIITSGSSSSAGTAANSRSGVSEGSEISTQTNADFWAEIESAIRTIVGREKSDSGAASTAGSDNGRRVVVSQHTGVIVVRAMPKELREVEDFLRSSKLSVERQVMLEAKIVEVTLNEGAESGINWASLNSAGNHRISVGADPSRVWVPGSVGRSYGLQDGAIVTPVDASGIVTPTKLSELVASPATAGSAGLLGIAFSTNTFYGLLSFLESQGKVQVLSSPRVAAVNNQKAVLRVGTDDFFVTNVSTTITASSSGNITTPTITVQPFFSGIALDVTPQVDTDGMVTMHVRPSVSVVSEKTRLLNLGTLGSFRLPLASSNVNETDTVVRVQDGNIVAIGGLMQQDETEDKTQVPGVGDLPGVGHFFKRTSRSIQKRELVFLIRASVIKNDADWRKDLADAEGRLQTMELPARTLRQRLSGE